MKVIIKKDNTVKDVSEGYAQNYLLPRGLAIIASPQEIQKRDQQLKQAEAQRKQQDKEDEKYIESVSGKEFTIKTDKIGATGKLFGSITAKEISEHIGINKQYIQLSAPIKESGAHYIELKAGQYHAKITITVTKEGTK